MKTTCTFVTSMLFLLPALVSAAEPPAARAKTIAPFLDEQAVVIAVLDLERLKIGPTIDRLAETLPDLGAFRDLVKSAATVAVNQLNAAGVKDVYFIVSLSDFNPKAAFRPRVVVPLAAGSDEQVIKDVLNLLQLTAQKKIGNAIMAGTPEMIERFPTLKITEQPDLAAAFAAHEGSLLQTLVVIPQHARRIADELMPTLPPQLGGGATKVLTRGFSWASLAVDAPQPLSLRFTIQAADAAAADEIRKTIDLGLKFLSEQADVRKSIPRFDVLIKLFTPKLKGDQLTITLDEQNQGFDSLKQALIPEVNRARQAARRVQSMNNLKQIALAMFVYESTKRRFPDPANYDANGQPLLSWRVHVLPYLEQDALYKQFKLNEPWNSDHNKKLIEKIPPVFRSPLSNSKEVGVTNYLLPVGKDTVFPDGKSVAMPAITDGTSNTLLIVEADDEHAAIWTKPDDLAFNPEKPRNGLTAGPLPDGFLAAFCDGSVRFIPKTVPDATIKLLIMRSDGQPVPAF